MVKRKVRWTKGVNDPSGDQVIAVGDKVRILTKRFGPAYEKGRKRFTKGIVQGIVGKVYEVLWDGDSESMKSHITRTRPLDFGRFVVGMDVPSS